MLIKTKIAYESTFYKNVILSIMVTGKVTYDKKTILKSR